MTRHARGAAPPHPVRDGRAAPPARPSAATPGSRDVVPGTIPVLAELGLSPTIARDRWSALDVDQRQALLRLRGHDADDVDAAETTEHLWLPDRTGPAAYARLVRSAAGEGRVDLVCGEEELRHLGLPSVLVADVVARYGSGPLLVHAPADLVPYLTRCGFTVAQAGGPGPDPEPGTTLLRRVPEAPWR